MGSNWCSHIISVEQSSDASQNTSLSLVFSSSGWSGADHSLSKSREWQALQPDAAMTGESREKQTLAAEKHGLQISGLLDGVVNALGKRNETAGVDAQGFAVQFTLDDGPSGVEEGIPVSFQLLQNKTFPAKESGPQALVEGDRHLRAFCRTEEGIFLAGKFSADRCKVYR